MLCQTNYGIVKTKKELPCYKPYPVDAFVPKGALWHSEGISVCEWNRPQKVGVQLLLQECC